MTTPLRTSNTLYLVQNTEETSQVKDFQKTANQRRLAATVHSCFCCVFCFPCHTLCINEDSRILIYNPEYPIPIDTESTTDIEARKIMDMRKWDPELCLETCDPIYRKNSLGLLNPYEWLLPSEVDAYLARRSLREEMI